jgi:hypothetical protein
LHVLANRLGVHHSQTKPDACWILPFVVTHGDDLENDMIVHSVTGSTAKMWGSADTAYSGSVGHWCTEVPDHYTGTQPVYKYGETELRLLLSDKIYERMVVEIEKIGVRRYPMPGETLNGGRKSLPLLVVNRQRQWAAEGGHAEQIDSAQSWLDQQFETESE